MQINKKARMPRVYRVLLPWYLWYCGCLAVAAATALKLFTWNSKHFVLLLLLLLSYRKIDANK